MQLLCKNDNYELYEYNSSIWDLFGNNLEPHSFLTKIRFILEIIRWGGFKVYYLKIDGEYVASCIVSHGKNTRYFFASEQDIIVGPYYVAEEHRGKGLSEQLLQLVLDKTTIPYCSAWDYINRDNIASIKASEKVGFQKFTNVDISSLTHKIKENKQGKYIIYRYKRKGITHEK